MSSHTTTFIKAWKWNYPLPLQIEQLWILERVKVTNIDYSVTIVTTKSGADLNGVSSIKRGERDGQKGGKGFIPKFL